jgi:two-component system, NarL family, nitrate/nitrite response regulator NarL
MKIGVSGRKNMQRTRLLLLDDHALFRDSLSRLLESEEDFEVVACCGTSAEALAELGRTPADVVLLDFDLGEDHGNSFLASARREGFEGKVLIVTAGMSESDASLALQRGASGIFLKHDSPITLAQAIRLVAGGGTWLDSKLVQSIASKAGRHEDSKSKRALTTREQEVLEGIFEGLTNKEIAGRVGVSESAIKATLQQLFEKLHVRTRSQLVRVALEGSYFARS